MNSPATKGDIKRLEDATKADLKRLEETDQRLAKAVVELQEEVRGIKQNMARKDDVSLILNAIDSFAQKGETYDQKAVSHGAILVDHEDKLRDYGRRITRLEKSA